MCHESMEQWLVVQQDVIAIAADGGCWAIGKFGTGRCSPEGKTIVTRVVQEFQILLQSMIVEFVWA
jgi:hypothetical protein